MQRRTFLKSTAIATTGIWLHAATGCSFKNSGPVNKNFGLQLYTLRDEMPKDPRGVLRQLASFGYKQVESFEHNSMGMFWGMKPAEFQQYVSELDMKAVSSHCDINKDFARKVDMAKEAGLKYLICPYLGPQKDMDVFRKAADQFNKCGELCKQAGLRFAYHNHDYSFQPLEGLLPQDVLMQNTDAGLVDYEMDIYWVVTAGQDPAAWFAKYPNRFTLSHIKDRRKGAPSSEKNASVVVGTGSIDYAALLQTAKKNGLKYYIVEQEAYAGTTPLAAVEANAAYMKTLKA